VQLDTAGDLIWTADGTHLPGYQVRDGLYIPAESACHCWFEVRFGTSDGERRAYLTADYGHDNPGTIVDLEVAGGVLVVRRTDVFPPGTYTLSGAVTEQTPTGRVPLEGVRVLFPIGSGYRGATTAKDGLYEIPGLYDGSVVVSASKEGYVRVTGDVSINGNTSFDIQLIRQ